MLSGRSPEDLGEDLGISRSGAAKVQPIYAQPYQNLPLHLLSCLEELIFYKILAATPITSNGVNQNSELLLLRGDKNIKHHNSYYQHNNKGVLWAVLAFFTFWWWYYSIWICGLPFTGNDAKQKNPLPNHRSRQKHTLIGCKISESVISANKKYALSKRNEVCSH